MEIHLIQGEFNPKDALDLVTKMIHVKIKYHESKISENSSEEDIKYRETKIKKLQKELYDFRKGIDEKVKCIRLNSTVQIESK
jgi:hypothetical protein